MSNMRPHQSGVTLLEVLITLLVMSVGLLGVAALNAFSLQSGQSSLQRTQASIIAGETLDWMRAHRSYFSESAADLSKAAEGIEDRYVDQMILPCLGVSASRANDGAFVVEVSWLVDRRIDSQEECPEEGMTSLTKASAI